MFSIDCYSDLYVKMQEAEIELIDRLESILGDVWEDFSVDVYESGITLFGMSTHVSQEQVRKIFSLGFKRVSYVFDGQSVELTKLRLIK